MFKTYLWPAVLLTVALVAVTTMAVFQPAPVFVIEQQPNVATGIVTPKQPVVIGTFEPIPGTQQLTVADSGVTSLTVPTGALFALIQAYDVNIRWRDDGTAVTSSVGQCLFAEQSMWYDGNLDAIGLRSISGNAEVNVSYYKL